MEIFLGILIPFIGTMLGAACVFFMKKALDKHIVDRVSFPDMHDSFFPGKMGNSSSDKYPQKRKMQQQVSPVLSPEPFPAKKDHYQLDSQYPL